MVGVRFGLDRIRLLVVYEGDEDGWNVPCFACHLRLVDTSGPIFPLFPLFSPLSFSGLLSLG